MEYPHTVQIETSGICNAACGFCPHSSMDRSAKDKMPDEMFYGLIDQMAEWETPPAKICPFLTNEPFADNRIYDFCCYINSRLPKTNLVFFTNGALFTDRNLLRLAHVKNIECIHISLHHSNKGDYEAELHIPWERTIESVHRGVEHCIEAGIKITILRVQDGDLSRDQRFLQFVRKEFPGALSQLSYRYNWKGDIASTFTDLHLDVHCPRLGNLHILCDGRAALCCLDQNGDYCLGDTKTDSLLAIYNGPKAITYRSQVKRMNEPCSKCNMR
jgi:sulfatase maturation enzyme AslB (radical SAM superfamily)